MASGEAWARVSLRIASESMTSQEIAQVIGVDSSAPPAKPWAIDITTDSSIALEDQLPEVKGFLRGRIDTLGIIGDAEINLSISWTPRAPQDGIVLDAELVALLARLKCYVLLDTYSD